MVKKTLLFRLVDELRFNLNNYYSNIALSIHEWDGMPEQIPQRIPEKTLYEVGLATFFEHPKLGYMCLPVAIESIQNNPYGEPSAWRAFCIGDMAGLVSTYPLNTSNAVLIRNEPTYTPSKPAVRTWIDQMINVELTMRMNINANKMPFMFKGTIEQTLQNKQTFMDLYESEPVFLKEALASDEFEVLNNNVPYLGKDLSDTYDEYDSRILSYLGIDNLPVEKKERLLTGEVEINSESLNLIRGARMKCRKLAAEQINKMFPDLNISVKLNDIMTPMNKASVADGDSGNDENENEM